MRLALSTAAALALLVMPGFVTEASAWGQDGHRIVCRIAFQLLGPTQQAEIIRLTGLYKRPDGGTVPSFMEGCIFPDEARTKAGQKLKAWLRFAEFDSWHFLNVPRTAQTIEEADCHNNCVLTGIARHAALVGKAPDDQARAEALFFLSHWLGDIHQPLHISYEDDRGGNFISPIAGGFYQSSNLHSVWDTGIVINAEGSQGWRMYADGLAKQIDAADQTAWGTTPPLEWARESYAITTTSGPQYCDWQTVKGVRTCVRLQGGRTLDRVYQAIFQDDVETRLKQAGARLANLLRPLLP